LAKKKPAASGLFSSDRRLRLGGADGGGAGLRAIDVPVVSRG
jgi:hypothetical protein